MIDIDTQDSLDQEPNIIDDITGFATQEPKGSETSEASIDAIFGNGDESEDGTARPTGEPEEASSTGKEKLSPEEYVRKLQSQADKAAYAVKQLEAQNKELSGAADFVNQLYEDEAVFKAFVAEINPELVKPPNPEDYIRNSLGKEFGSDFVPDEAEENIRGSRTWMYNKRADDLYNEAITKSSKKPETIAQIRERRAKAQQEFQLKAEQEKHAILSEFKWSDADYNGFLNWANKVNTMDFAKLYQYGQSKKNAHKSSSPNLATLPGRTPLGDSAYSKELDNFFG